MESAQADIRAMPINELNKPIKLVPGKNRIDDLIGHFSYAEHPEDLAAPPLKVRAEQRSYATLRVRGFSREAACRQLRLNRTTCTRWEQEEWFDVVCEEERRSWLIGAGIDEKQEILLPLVPDTIKAIKDVLHSEDEKIRLTAAQFVLDNIFGGEKRGPGRPKKTGFEIETLPDLSDIMNIAADKVARSKENSSDDSATSIVSSAEITAKFEEEFEKRIESGYVFGLMNGNTQLSSE